MQVGKQNFAQRAHDEKQHEAGDRIDEQDRRPRQRNGFARPHEKAGADRAADGDQLEVSIG